MSAKHVQAFLDMAQDDAFRADFEAAAPPARREMLAKAKLDISLEEAEAALAGEWELGDQGLDQVAGGDAGVVRFKPPTSP